MIVPLRICALVIRPEAVAVPVNAKRSDTVAIAVAGENQPRFLPACSHEPHITTSLPSPDPPGVIEHPSLQRAHVPRVSPFCGISPPQQLPHRG